MLCRHALFVIALPHHCIQHVEHLQTNICLLPERLLGAARDPAHRGRAGSKAVQCRGDPERGFDCLPSPGTYTLRHHMMPD